MHNSSNIDFTLKRVSLECAEDNSCRYLGVPKLKATAEFHRGITNASTVSKASSKAEE